VLEVTAAKEVGDLVVTKLGSGAGIQYRRSHCVFALATCADESEAR